jgi:leucyl/phenylalanyl-tRNA--protein transferase
LLKALNLYKERREFFLDPRHALAEGVVAVTNEVTPELLFEAYSFGIFPWPHSENDPILWFCPPQRAVLVFDELHIPRSLAKHLRRCSWKVTVNKDFLRVIESCADSYRPDQTGTWITPQMVNAYLKFHKMGFAHSLECWDQGSLIGGLYGVCVGGVFSAESMFYSQNNASKVCLLSLIESLKAQGMQWMDIQTLTPHMKVLGARLIDRGSYLAWVAEAKRTAKDLFR